MKVLTIVTYCLSSRHVQQQYFLVRCVPNARVHLFHLYFVYGVRVKKFLPFSN